MRTTLQGGQAAGHGGGPARKGRGQWAALLLGVLLVPGCAAAPVEVVDAPPGPLPGLSLLAVCPVAFLWPVPAEEAYRKDADLLAALGGGTSVDLLGPDEFRCEDRGPDEADRALNALLVARSLGYLPASVGLVRVRIEQRLQQGTRQVFDLAGQPRGVRTEQDRRFVVHGELWQLSPSRLVVSLRATARHDPFAEHPDWDEQPELRQALHEVGRVLAERVADAAGRPAVALASGFAFTTNPVGMLDRREPLGQGTLRERLARLDELEQELHLWRAFQYFQPEISPSRARELSLLPPGVLVEAAPPVAGGSGLRPGDLIVSVGDRPVAHVAALRRELARQRTAPLGLRRGRVELQVAWTDDEPAAP